MYACYAGQGTYLNPGYSAASWTLTDNNGSTYYDPFDQCGATFNGFGVISRGGGYARPPRSAPWFVSHRGGSDWENRYLDEQPETSPRQR